MISLKFKEVYVKKIMARKMKEWEDIFMDRINVMRNKNITAARPIGFASVISMCIQYNHRIAHQNIVNFAFSQNVLNDR